MSKAESSPCFYCSLFTVSPLIIWWYDIYKVLETYKNELDWNYITNSVKKYEAGMSVYSTIFTLKEWFTVFLPEVFLKEAQGNFEIFPIERVVPSPSEQIKFWEKSLERDYLSNLGEIEGIGKKAKIILGDIFPQKKYMIIKYQIKDNKLLFIKVKKCLYERIKGSIPDIKI